MKRRNRCLCAKNGILIGQLLNYNECRIRCTKWKIVWWAPTLNWDVIVCNFLFVVCLSYLSVVGYPIFASPLCTHNFNVLLVSPRNLLIIMLHQKKYGAVETSEIECPVLVATTNIRLSVNSCSTSRDSTATLHLPATPPITSSTIERFRNLHCTAVFNIWYFSVDTRWKLESYKTKYKNVGMCELL